MGRRLSTALYVHPPDSKNEHGVPALAGKPCPLLLSARSLRAQVITFCLLWKVCRILESFAAIDVEDADGFLSVLEKVNILVVRRQDHMAARGEKTRELCVLQASNQFQSPPTHFAHGA